MMRPFSFLDNYESFLIAEKRYSSHTITAYLADLHTFLDFAVIKIESEVLEVETFLVRSWIVDLKKHGISNRSIQRKLSSLRAYFGWLRKTTNLEVNPVQRITGPKTEKRLPVFVKQEHLTPDKTDTLFSNDFEGMRDKLLFELLYQTGIRLSEAINLKELAVNEQSIRVLGKRNKERIIPIHKPLYELIRSYIKEKRKLGFDATNLLVLKNGKNIYEKFVYRKINSYLGSLSTNDKRSPHVLRHTFATHMLNNGAGLEVLKELLGHANLTATQVYTHNSFAELTKVYNQSHPRGGE